MAVPWIAVCTDAEGRRPGHAILDAGRPHPRTYGSTARVLGTYVRERGTLTLEAAVAKLTSVPAARLRLRDRGTIREGAFADLVVFDPATVADEATYLEPARHPSGIEHVIVNGSCRGPRGSGDRAAAGASPATGRVTRSTPEATEQPAIARLPGGPVPYTLRRSPRARTLRVVIHPERGVVVTVPVAARRGWSDPERHVDTFLAEREPWLRRHLARQSDCARTARGARRPGGRCPDPIPRRPPPVALRGGRARHAAIERGADRRRGRGPAGCPPGNVGPSVDGRRAGGVVPFPVQDRDRARHRTVCARASTSARRSSRSATLARAGGARRAVAGCRSRGGSSWRRPRRSRPWSSMSWPTCGSSATDRPSGPSWPNGVPTTSRGATGSATTPSSCTARSISRGAMRAPRRRR